MIEEKMSEVIEDVYRAIQIATEADLLSEVMAHAMLELQQESCSVKQALETAIGEWVK